MRFGCCVNMFASPEDPLGRRFLPELVKNGYDYVEIPLAQTMELREDAFRELLRELRSLGLPCEACNNFFPASLRLTGPDVCGGRTEEYGKRALERAARLGAQVIVFGSGPAKNIPEGFDPSEGFRQITELLHHADRWAEPYGIRIALEPLNRLESNIIRTLEEADALRNAVNLPRVQLLVDFYHLYKENEPWESVRQRTGHIIHAHMAEGDARRFPKEGGDTLAFLRQMKDWGYSERVSVEAFSQDPAGELKVLRPLLEAL